MYSTLLFLVQHTRYCLAALCCAAMCWSLVIQSKACHGQLRGPGNRSLDSRLMRCPPPDTQNQGRDRISGGFGGAEVFVRSTGDASMGTHMENVVAPTFGKIGWSVWRNQSRKKKTLLCIRRDGVSHIPRLPISSRERLVGLRFWNERQKSLPFSFLFAAASSKA
jgi:hypothetical protein